MKTVGFIAAGCSSERPSELVEKIIDKIRNQERSMKRQQTQLSFRSDWTYGGVGASVGALELVTKQPSRHLQAELGFAWVVRHVQHQTRAFTKSTHPPLKGARAFKVVRCHLSAQVLVHLGVLTGGRSLRPESGQPPLPPAQECGVRGRERTQGHPRGRGGTCPGYRRRFRLVFLSSPSPESLQTDRILLVNPKLF